MSSCRARREGGAVAAAAGRVHHRLRAGHARGAVHRREGRADAGAPEPVAESTIASIPTARRWRCGPARCAWRWKTAPTRASCRACGSPAHTLHDLLGSRRPFLTAKRLLSNQTFRDLYRTDTLDVDQRLKITSLTFLFTDLRGSTELYERVGDLVAFDLVRAHFQVLQRDRRLRGRRGRQDHRRRGDGDVPDAGPGDRRRAAHARGDARSSTSEHGREDLLLKIGIHEGPCLAVTLNERQDYFGQTVNIASRVQGLADSQSIFATGAVVSDSKTADLLLRKALTPQSQSVSLRGIEREVPVYAIP